MAAPDNSPRTVLGVYVTTHTLEAVLLRATADDTKLVHRLMRPRLRLGDTAKADDFSSVLPGMKSSDEIDFTLEVGEGSSDLDLDDSILQSLHKGGGAAEGPKLFAAQLREILSECRALGYGTPDLAFCVDAPEVAYVELEPGTEKERGGGTSIGALWERASGVMSSLSPERRALLSALRAEFDGPFDPDRVAFVPLTQGEADRVLAIVPTAVEAVTPTVRTLEGTDESLYQAQRRLDAEASLLADVAGTYVSPEADAQTAVVRVGANDTLLLFLRGTKLQHVEHLRSLTSFDPAETICSRVLLHQDAARIDEIDHVVLVGGPRDGRLAKGFALFYDQSTIQELNDLLRAEISVPADLQERLTPDSGMAIASALRLLRGAATDLYGPYTKPRRSASAFGWHTVAVMVLLFATALFFGWRYMERQQEIASVQQRLSLSPVEMTEMTPDVLKHRVDSLNAVHAKHSRALHVLDSLLVGSDEWSRAIERTASQTEQIEGIWFDNWSVDATTIKLQGHALKRSNLAALARNLDGTINELKFTDIQGARAYPFTITIPRQIEMPEVTMQLREEALTPSMAPLKVSSVAKEGPSPTPAVRTAAQP